MKINKLQLKTMMLLLTVLLNLHVLNGQEIDSLNIKEEYKHAIDFSPLSPLFKIYGVCYSYQFAPKDEILIGAAYMNIHFDFGNTNAPALILGYRRYLWKKLHLEYQLMPSYDNFYEKNEDKYYKSFALWNEFRLGYQFDFTISKLPLYINLQWPFGFGLYSSNSPESYKELEKKIGFFIISRFCLLDSGFKTAT